MAVDYAAWLAGEYPRILLVEGTVYDSGSPTTLYLADRTYVTGGSDSPANTVYQGRVMDGTVIERSMGSAFYLRGGATAGELVLANLGDLDDWIDYVWYGNQVVMYFGNPDWDLADIKSEGKIFQGVFGVLEANDKEIRIPLEGRQLELEQPVQNVYETTGAIIGQFRPLCYGYPKNISPPITDPDSTPEFHVHEVGGIQDPAVARYINQAASTSPSISKDTTDDQRQFEINGDPNGLVTCDAKGVVDGSWLEKPGEILQHMLTREIDNTFGLAQGGTATTMILDDSASEVDDAYNGKTLRHAVFNDDGQATLYNTKTITDYDGATRTATVGTAWTNTPQEGDGYKLVAVTQHPGLLQTADLDTSAFTQLDTDLPYQVGLFINRDQSAEEVLEEVLGPGAFYGWNRAGKLTVGIIEDPSAATADLELEESDNWGILEIEDAPERLYRIRIGYDRNYTPQTGGVAGDLSSTRASYVDKEYRYHTKEDLSILDSNPEARQMEILTDYTDGGEARTELSRLWDLFSVRRRRYRVRSLTKPMQVDLGDVVQLTDARYGLSGGKKLVVQEIVEYPLQGKTEMLLWG